MSVRYSVVQVVKAIEYLHANDISPGHPRSHESLWAMICDAMREGKTKAEALDRAIVFRPGCVVFTSRDGDDFDATVLVDMSYGFGFCDAAAILDESEPF